MSPGENQGLAKAKRHRDSQRKGEGYRRFSRDRREGTKEINVTGCCWGEWRLSQISN